MGLHRFHTAGLGSAPQWVLGRDALPQPWTLCGSPLRQKHQNGASNGNKENPHCISRKLPEGEAGEAWEVGESPSVFAKYTLGGGVRLELRSVQEWILLPLALPFLREHP